LTLGLALILFVFQDKILETALHLFASDNYLLSLSIKIAIIFSLEPVNKAIEKIPVAEGDQKAEEGGINMIGCF
jgi:hypothetical protein